MFGESETGVDLLLMQTLFLSYANANLLVREQHDFHVKRRRVCIKTRSPPASFLPKGQVTKHTTEKWTIDLVNYDHSEKHGERFDFSPDVQRAGRGVNN